MCASVPVVPIRSVEVFVRGLQVLTRRCASVSGWAQRSAKLSFGTIEDDTGRVSVSEQSTANMGPVNAAVRFVCEIAAIYGIASGAWAWTGSVPATVLAPVAAMSVWGVFRVPGDPGPAPVAVTGPVRLAIEILVFGAGIAGVWAANGRGPALVFLMVVVLHYATTPRRLRHVLSSHR